MARLADGTRLVGLVATDAARHAGDCGGLHHLLELAHLAVAVHALYARLEVLAMRPGDAGGHLIHAHPGNRLSGASELGELLNCRAVLGDAIVAARAGGDSRERHLVAGLGIDVALPALQSAADMSPVAEGQRL